MVQYFSGLSPTLLTLFFLILKIIQGCGVESECLNPATFPTDTANFLCVFGPSLALTTLAITHVKASL